MWKLFAVVVVASSLAACASSSSSTAASPATATAGAPAAAAPAVDRGLEPPPPTLRLPRNFLPTKYEAKLAIDPAKSGFTGAIQIIGNVSERSSLIWLHGHHLTVRHAVARRDTGEVALSVRPHGEDLLEIRAARPLERGAWTLAIDYAGEYDERGTTGAFKQTVHDAPYVFSQFEALYARRVFPCFDEPDNKVPWELTLEVPKGLLAVSNTAAGRVTSVSTTTSRFEFAVTKPLPSYLVAFGVGPFDIVPAGQTQHGTAVRVIALKGRSGDAAYAAKTGARILDLLETFFGTPYPYGKLDLLSVPITVGFGAMENAGLVTFTESLILIDPKLASRQREHSWILVAAHELAHQWFGDLVTTAWWDDIWLNEGFATWVESKISAAFDPTWHDEIGEISSRSSALEDDRLITARQIRQPIKNTDDILNAFDNITYGKGASVLNMFEHYVGSDAFMRGVRAYIEAHRFGNATSDQLVAAISEASGKDIRAAFTSFLEQPGAPRITANLVCDPGQPPRVDLAQSRFVPPGAPEPPASKPWGVPVCVAFDRAGKRGDACTLLTAPTGSLALDAPSCPRWVMPNASGRGYYRNAYTPAQVTALRDVAWPQLAQVERNVLLFDVQQAMQAGELPLPLAQSFVPRLITAGDRFSLAAAMSIALTPRDFVADGLRAAYEAWIRKTFGPAAHRAGLLPSARDTLDVESSRAQLVAAVGDLGRDPVFVREAGKLAGHWRDLPEATRALVLAIAAHSQPALTEKLHKDVYTEDDRTRRGEIMYALASSPDVKEQRAALELVLDAKLDIRETEDMLFETASYPANIEVAKEFFRAHQAELLAKIPRDGTASGPAGFAYLFTRTCAPDKRDEIATYVKTAFAKLEGGARVVDQAIESMDQCIARRKVLEPVIQHWLGH
ncbi:MAG TPA: M1 family aminopeptidase [Kofleriaceae bacterium]|nr:M1 family aminopeptidase [Kofleriaceae bacterium]